MIELKPAFDGDGGKKLTDNRHTRCKAGNGILRHIYELNIDDSALETAKINR